MFLGCASSQDFAQIAAPPDRLAGIKKLFDEERWEELVKKAESLPARGAEADYYYGFALSRLGRWDEARTAFLAGQRLRPRDERFPIELGGVSFKQKRYAEAARWLERGLRLAPNDAYANDFLATIYFLEDNLEAALKYWNRVAKPRIESVRVEPGLRVEPALLDRAMAFAPAGTLRLSDLLTSQARVGGLGIFPNYSFHLEAQDDGRFDVAFRAEERNGWGNSKWEALLATFRGAFYQTIYPEYSNRGGSATNLSSLARWDAQKRRLLGRLSAPFEHNPQYRYEVGLDLRDENWDLRASFKGPAPLLGALNLQREAIHGVLTSWRSGAWSWRAGAELSARDYRNVVRGSALPAQVLLSGTQLKQLVQLNHEWLRVPERRFESNASIISEAGAIWSAPTHSFEKLQGVVAASWYPQMSGDDYAMRGQLRSGKTFGSVPFDELFMLGMERDNDLWMRAHVGTRDGRKGSAPLGRNYSLFNWEMDKNLYDNGFLSVKLSPFLDGGKSTDPLPGLGSRQWLWDAGVQAKFRLLGVGVTFIYGKDLCSGKNAFYGTAR